MSISENGTIQKLGTVSYSHSIATVAVSLADLTQYMNVTDRQTPSQTLHDGALMHSIVQQKLDTT